LNEKIIGDDAFAVTTSKSENGPSLRNVFVIEHLTNPESKEVVHYGDKFRIVALLPNNIKVFSHKIVVISAKLASESPARFQDHPESRGLNYRG
jgi:hypothetical protein